MGVDDEKLNEIKADAKAMVDAAVRFAEESPDPPLDELYTDVYADTVAADGAHS
jgi:pyruvate dehydrogenase E1 component subunit alpha